jgi:enterochelin esterase-like enzyme
MARLGGEVRRQPLVVRERVGDGPEQEQHQRSGEREGDHTSGAAELREARQPGPDGGPSHEPGRRHPRERLGVVARELLERERARHAWRKREDPRLAQQVQPAEARDHRHEGKPRRTGERPKETPAVSRRLPSVLMSCWLLVGLYGAWLYVHHYDLYRGFPPPTEPASIPHGRLREVSFWSTALGQRRHYLIYLPPGYERSAAAGRRFPVLYLLHAPAGKGQNYVLAGGLDVRVDELLASGSIRPFITVIPLGHAKLFGSDHEWANARAGRYEDFVLDTVSAVDSRWSTIGERRGRMLAGLSAGAYGAVNITLHHLSVFGSFESWSGYFTQTATYTFAGASPAELRANSPADYLPSVAPTIRRLGLSAYLYQGRSDDVPVGQMIDFANRLGGAGARVSFAVYGGKHNWALWREHFSQMLRYASAVFEGRA